MYRRVVKGNGYLPLDARQVGPGGRRTPPEKARIGGDVTTSHSTTPASRKQPKAAEPMPDFPLYPHLSGKWGKTIMCKTSSPISSGAGPP